MLAVWREWNLDKILEKAWKSGVVLAGMSAGAICWFEYGGTDSINNNKMSSLKGLGLIQGSCTPHYDGESNRRPDLHQLLKNGELPSGVGIDDGTAILFQEQQIVEVVSSRPKAKAYKVKIEENKQVVEESLKTRFLR